MGLGRLSFKATNRFRGQPLTLGEGSRSLFVVIALTWGKLTATRIDKAATVPIHRIRIRPCDDMAPIPREIKGNNLFRTFENLLASIPTCVEQVSLCKKFLVM